MRIDPQIPSFLTEWMTQEQWATTFSVIQAVVILLVVVLIAALMSFIERRLLAWWQDRYGPNRVGPFGIFQIVADMLKIMFKEDWLPQFSDKRIFIMAPAIAMATALLSFAVIPISPTLGVADLSIGLLFFFGMAALAVYSVMFGGWASNNKYSLLGSIRSTAQTISYEVFMGLSVMGVVMLAGSFNMRDIVEAQRDGWFVQKLNRKAAELNDRYKDKSESFGNDFKQAFLDNFSKVLFYLLPVFALLLKLFYIRRDFFYSEHLVFSIYYYNFFYFAASLMLLFNQISWLGWLSTLTGFWIYFYLLFAMKRMYGQSWLKTIAKFTLFSFSFMLFLGVGLAVSALAVLLMI